MKRKQNGYVSIVLIVYLVILLVGATGWIKNIVKFVNCDFENSYKAEIIRGIGIPVAPLGVVLGFVDIEDGKKMEP